MFFSNLTVSWLFTPCICNQKSTLSICDHLWSLKTSNTKNEGWKIMTCPFNMVTFQGFVLNFRGVRGFWAPHIQFNLNCWSWQLKQKHILFRGFTDDVDWGPVLENAQPYVSWLLKPDYFEDLNTPAKQVHTVPLEGPLILTETKFWSVLVRFPLTI